MPPPHSLAGKRCLDIGTFHGRGAAEVIAIGILDPNEWDWPFGSTAEAITTIGRRMGKGRGFEIACRELGSSVRRIERSAYDVALSATAP